MKASSETQRYCGVGKGGGWEGETHIESDTEKQDKSGSEGLISSFDKGTTGQLTGHWQVSSELELVALPTLWRP